MKCDQVKTKEEVIEMKDFFERGHLHKVKKNQVPVGTQIIGSRFQNKIKRHHAGNYRLEVKRLKARLVVQGHDMSHFMTTSCEKVESTSDGSRT